VPAPQLTLDTVITEACELFAPNDAPTRYFDAALKHAKAFRRELIGSTNQENKHELLEVGNDRTADLPDDYAGWVRLGVLSADEQHIYPLLYSNDVLPTQRSSFRAADLPDYWMQHGGFSVEPSTHRIVCNSLVPEGTVLVLEYKSLAAEMGEDIAIDPLSHTWAVQYILRELHKQRKDWQSAAEAEKDCLKANHLYKQAVRNFSLTDAMHIKHVAAAQLWK
jgi:hypothetical protein